ncbi:hypothetical protein L204_105954 [Cryptococcus depauperatus]
MELDTCLFPGLNRLLSHSVLTIRRPSLGLINQGTGQRTVPVETTNAGMSRYNDAVQGQRVQNEETVARSQADSQVPSYIRGDGRDYGATEYLETGTIVYYPVQRRR